MNELELLEQLQTIQNKLENNEELTDQESKLFASVIFVTAVGVIEKRMKSILDFLGDEDE